MSKLRKLAQSDSAGELVTFADELLKKALTREAQEIGFDYDDSVYQLQSQHPKYMEMVQKLEEIGSIIDALAEEWAVQTEQNYGDMLDK